MYKDYTDIHKQIKTSLTSTVLLRELNKLNAESTYPLLKYSYDCIVYPYFNKKLPISFKYVKVSEKVYNNIMDNKYDSFSNNLASKCNDFIIKNRLKVKTKMADLIESKIQNIKNHKLLRIINTNSIDDIVDDITTMYNPKYLLTHPKVEISIYNKDRDNQNFIDLKSTRHMENEFIAEFVKEYGIDYEDIYISKRHPYLVYNIGGFRERFPILIKFDEFEHPSILVYLFNDSSNKKNFFGTSISKDVVESYNFNLYLYKMIRGINLLNIKDKNLEIKDYMECDYYDQLDKFYSDIINKFFPSSYENKFIKNYRYINTNLNLPDINNSVVGYLTTTGNFPMFEMIIDNIRNALKYNSIKFTYGKYRDFTEEMIGICSDITSYAKASEIINFIRQEFLNKDFTIKYFNGLQGKVKFIYDYDQFNGKKFNELNEDYFISNNELFKLNLVTY